MCSGVSSCNFCATFWMRARKHHASARNLVDFTQEGRYLEAVKRRDGWEKQSTGTNMSG